MTTKLKGVMIIGLKMPNRCVVCPLLRKNTVMGDYCFMENRRGLANTHVFNQRPSWCPLQEVK